MKKSDIPSRLVLCYHGLVVNEGFNAPIIHADFSFAYWKGERGAYICEYDSRWYDLQVVSQGELTQDVPSPHRWYSWRLEYRDCFFVDRHRAEAMVDTIRWLERQISRLSERFGVPTDYPTYLRYIADILGIQEAQIKDGTTKAVIGPSSWQTIPFSEMLLRLERDVRHAFRQTQLPSSA